MKKPLFYKKFFKYLILIFILLTFSIALTNAFLDRYGIFKTDYKKQKYLPNERYVKINYLLKNPNKYDSFIMGSSRAGSLQSKTIKNGKFYILDFPVASPYELLRYLNIFIKNKIKIKTIILCLENDSFKADDYPYAPIISSKDPLFFYYPENFKQKINFYYRYLALNPLLPSTETLKFNPVTAFDSGSDSQLIDLKTCKSSNKKITQVYKNTSPYNMVNIGILKEYTAICKKNNINLIVLIIPELSESYYANDIAKYNYYKKKLAEITPYYDFSGVNSYTTNDVYFHDYRHFNACSGAKILERIYSQDKFSKPEIEGFGDYVTKDNIDEHIKTLCSKTSGVQNCIPK